MVEEKLMQDGVTYKTRHKGARGRNDCKYPVPHKHLWGKGTPSGKVVELGVDPKRVVKDALV